MKDDFDQWRKQYLKGLNLFWRDESARIVNDLKVSEAIRKARYQGSTWDETTANERYYRGMWPND